MSTTRKDDLNLPSVEDFPACINCIYSFDDGEECKRSQPRDADGWCGYGVFAVGDIPQRRLLSYREWWEDEIRRANDMPGEAPAFE